MKLKGLGITVMVTLLRIYRVQFVLLISSQSKVETYLHFFDSKFNNWFGIFALYYIQAV